MFTAMGFKRCSKFYLRKLTELLSLSDLRTKMNKIIKQTGLEP